MKNVFAITLALFAVSPALAQVSQAQLDSAWDVPADFVTCTNTTVRTMPSRDSAPVRIFHAGRQIQVFGYGSGSEWVQTQGAVKLGSDGGFEDFLEAEGWVHVKELCD